MTGLPFPTALFARRRLPQERALHAMFPDHAGAGLVLAEGLIQAPRFTPDPDWISAGVAGTLQNGARGPGWAETALIRRAPDAALLDRSARLARRMLDARLGGACWADPAKDLPRSDYAVIFAAGGEAATTAMIDAAAEMADGAKLVLVLPATLCARAGNSRLTARVGRLGGRILHGDIDPWSLLERAARVHAGGNAPEALLALLAGVPLHCHLAGLAAGWGATQDAAYIRPRAVRRDAGQILAAALLQGSRYRNPFTGQRAQAEDMLELAAEWRRLGDANRRVASLVGMSGWKRRRMAQFFHTGAGAPPFHATPADAIRAARPDRLVAAWSSRIPAGLFQPDGPRVARVEDGFVRSVGLGCDFLPPCSIVVDADGIYLDPSRPSLLEAILARGHFDDAVLARARALAARLVAGGISKYGVAKTSAVRLHDDAAGKRRILVPGQVADDLSVRLGGAGTWDNLTLLTRVRAANPDAFIIYKPHPDVDAGHRHGRIPDAVALRHANQILRGTPMPAMIEAVHEIHTITSLAGFEALLRGRAVTCYGQPFYSGWGLTHDIVPHPRRTRRLTLEQLVAGALLLYPRYLDPVTGLPCPAEVLLDRLSDPVMSRALGQASLLSRARRIQGRVLGRLWRQLSSPAPLPLGEGKTV